MHETLEKLASEVMSEIELIQSDDINKEAIENIVSFGAPTKELNDWGKLSVKLFIEECCNIYKSCNDESMVFYSWFDEQVGNFCISAVSENHNKLPFGCKLNVCDLETMINGLFNQNCGLFSSSKKLNVWKERI